MKDRKDVVSAKKIIPGFLSTFFRTNTSKDYDRDVNPKFYEMLAELVGRKRLGAYIAEQLQIYLPSTVHDKKKVLDLGAGTGLISEELHRQSYEVTAADLSTNALEYLREKRPHIHAIALDANTPLPLSNESFDGITTVFANRYMNDTKKLLGETFRLLKPGGVFLWPLFESESLTSWKNFGMLKKFDPKVLSDQAKEVGFQDVKILQPGLGIFKIMMRKFLRPEYIPVFIVAVK